VSDDATRSEAKRRSIGARMLVCNEAELDALDRMLTAVEKRRDIVPAAARTAWPDRVRADQIEAGLRELAAATTYAPRRPFDVLNGERED
jgi:hypothetical protein